MTTPDVIAEALRPHIERVGQTEVARLSGVAQSNISAWLAGKRTMSPRAVGMIVEALNLELRAVRRRS